MVLWDDLIASSIVEKEGNGVDIQFANDVNTPPASPITRVTAPNSRATSGSRLRR
jgi:hypothetical protein